MGFRRGNLRRLLLQLAKVLAECFLDLWCVVEEEPWKDWETAANDAARDFGNTTR